VADDDVDCGHPRPFVLQSLGWGHRDAVAFIVGAVAATAILINALFLQSGPHPAPMFKSALMPVGSVPIKDASMAVLPRPRPVEPAPIKAEPTPVKPDAQAAARAGVEIVSDIQRELARRGYYEGTIDGRQGPKTDAAIRDFEQAAGLKPSLQPNEALLRAIKSSNVKVAKAATSGAPATPLPAVPVRTDPIAEALAPSKRVLAVQRALAEFGYGQLRPSGIVDPETRAAIEKFERERRLPVTGQISDRVTRELAAITGRPLE
jgi:peptidoglycan hydrolase-like protein with peptidoglycan-binding domain